MKKATDFKISGFFTIGGDLPPPCRTKVMEQSPLISENSGYETIQFVVWTVSCLYDLPVQSLHLPNTATGLGSGLPRCEQHRLP